MENFQPPGVAGRRLREVVKRIGSFAECLRLFGYHFSHECSVDPRKDLPPPPLEIKQIGLLQGSVLPEYRRQLLRLKIQGGRRKAFGYAGLNN